MADEFRHIDAELRHFVYSASSSIHGQGLFAARFIAPGAYIGTYWGPEVTQDDIYVLWLCDDDCPDQAIGRDGSNLLRFLNHQRPGNAEFDGFDLYALRAIRPDEEITFDYGSDWLA